jgi:hypothetical protein
MTDLGANRRGVFAAHCDLSNREPIDALVESGFWCLIASRFCSARKSRLDLLDASGER